MMLPTACPTPDLLASCLDSHLEPDPRLCEHVEQCPACQRNLETLAGEPSWWRETESLLREPRDERADRVSRPICALASTAQRGGLPASLATHETDHLKRLLDEPSHPELLGRIGRYELEQLVGRGGMGLVFRALDTELHRVVAVKILALPILDHPEARERFVREARVSASLVHPHIVPVHDVITDGPIPALVMQFVAGTTLETRLQAEGKLPWREAILIGLQLAEALATAHRHGLVHRDIKPGNVMLEAGGSRALLTDFGLVRALDTATLTRSGVLAGTPDFMSPEQARGAAVDERSDLFSLGSLIYTMLAGQPPFRAADPMATLNRICHQPHRRLQTMPLDLPRRVCRLIDRMLVKDPASRIGSASQCAQALQDLLCPDAPPESVWHHARDLLRRKSVAALALAVLLAGGLSLQSRWMSQQNEVQIERLGNRLAEQLQSATSGDSYSSQAAANLDVPYSWGIDARIDRLKRSLDSLAAGGRSRGDTTGEFTAAQTAEPSYSAEIDHLWTQLDRLEAELFQSQPLFGDD